MAAASCGGSSAPAPFGVRFTAAASGKLWVLDEASARVIRLDPVGAASGSARVAPHPAGLRATGDGGWVVTLSAEPRTSTLTAVRATTSGELTPSRIAVRPHHNAFTVSTAPANRYAVTYVDLAALAGVVVDGTASFNEITVVDLNGTEPVATSVVVGFNPRQVVFTPDGTKAIVLSESFASVVPLANPAATVRVPLGANTATHPVTPQTAITTADNASALVARAGSADVFLITLSPPSVNILDFGIAPTRLISSSDGASILGIARGLPTIALLDLPTGIVRQIDAGGPVTDAAVPPDPLDRRMLLWGAGTQREEFYALDLDAATASTVALVNPATQIAIGPGGTAVVLHERSFTPGGDEVQQFFDAHEALSIVDRDVSLVTPIALDAEPATIAFFEGADGTPRALVPLEGSAHVAEIGLGDQLASALRVSDVPRDVVPLGAEGVAIVHDQPFGLVTFLRADGTMTVARGFLLDGTL